MDMVARRIVLPEGEEASRLPTVVKRETLDAHLGSTSLLERAGSRAARIVEEAEAFAERARDEIERTRREGERDGYREGLERARADAASELLDLTDMAAAFVSDVEASIVALVTAAVREIVTGFDDVSLIEATVVRALRAFGEGVRATLSVPESLRIDVERRLGEMAGAGSLVVVGDPSLRGSACRLESGRMVIVGGVDEQIDAMRAALEARIAGAREAVPCRDVSLEAFGDHHEDFHEGGA